MKKLLFLLIAVLLLVGIYYGSFYLRTSTVEEAAPAFMEKTGEVSSSTEMSAAGVSPTMRQGSFGDTDFFHRASGNALLLGDGSSRVLRFENFEVTNGPDLYVYLTKNDAPTSEKESLGDFISLGRLKGNKGNQNYEVPLSADDSYDTVVVWCQQFGVLFTKANLR